MGRFDKKPKSATPPNMGHPIKRPRSAPAAASFMQRHISLVFQFLDEKKNWRCGGAACQCDGLGMLGFLKGMESRPWSDVYKNPKRDHPIPPSKLEKPAQERLAELRMDDLDEIWSFHINQLGRMWGYRHEHELRLLWLDMDHQVYIVDIQDRDSNCAG
jgi:hypothetical protein